MNKKKLIFSVTILLSLVITACASTAKSESKPGSSVGNISSINDVSSEEKKTSSVTPAPSSQTQPSSNKPSSAVPSSKQDSSSLPTPSSAPQSSTPAPSSVQPSSEPVSSAQPSSTPTPSSTPAPSSEPVSSAPAPSSVPTPSSQVAPSSNPISSSAQSSIASNSGFKNINDTEPFEIHTADQKAYLSYQGNYDEMPVDQYPDGSVHQSDSKPIELTWDYEAPADKTVSKFSVVFGQKADLSDGYQVDGNNNPAISFYNPYLGTNYYKLIATFTNSTKEETEIRTFTVDSTYPRNLTIGGMTNCRDMGGRVTEDGGKVKQGLVYRTSGFKYDYSTQITEAGKVEMLEHLKVKTEVNVADSTKYNLALTGTTVKNLFMDYSGGSHHFSRNAESVKDFFDLLGDSSNYPVFFHCRIGTDRTGLCAILLSGLLGVKLNDIYQDYLFSNFGNIQEKRYIGTAAGADNIQNYIADIEAMSGEKFQNKVYNMLLSIGVSKNTLDTIISNLTEGTLPQGNDTEQVIARADVLTGEGVEVSNDTSDRNNPNQYYVLDDVSKSVSYTFNATRAYKGQIVAYLGNKDASTSKKIGESVYVSLNNNPVAVRDLTYKDARMGNCSGRVNYFPVVLGTADIVAGSNIIKIAGSSNAMNLGGIYIFDAATAPDSGAGEEGGEHTSHTYAPQTPVTNVAGKQVTTYLCSCGKKYIDIKFADYSSIDGVLASDGKIGGSTKVKTTLKWDIPAKAGNVTLMFNIKLSSPNSTDHKNHAFDSSLYSVKINGVAQTILLQNGKTYSELGFSGDTKYFDIASYQILNDENIEVEFVHNNSDYRLLFTENVRLMYAE